jgi:hypothetical protein
MGDETLTPFVDALSATLIIMILVAISFILQTALSLEATARGFVDVPIISKLYTPIEFKKPLLVNVDKREILYLVNFTLNDDDILKIKDSLANKKEFKVIIYTNQTEQKATVNILRFLSMIKLSSDVNVTTTIIQSRSLVGRLTWSK